MSDKAKTKKGNSTRIARTPKAGPKRVKGNGVIMQRTSDGLRDKPWHYRTTHEQRVEGRLNAELRKQFAYTNGGYVLPKVSVINEQLILVPTYGLAARFVMTSG